MGSREQTIQNGLVWLLLLAGILWSKESLITLRQSADELYKSGKFKQAANKYQQCLNNLRLEESTKDTIYFRMGECAEKTGQYLLSKHYYKQSMNYGFAAEGTSLSSLYQQANSEYKQLQDAYVKYNDTVYADIEKIILLLLEEKLDKRDRLEPLFLLGRAHVSLSQEDKARNVFKKVLKIDNHFEPFAASPAEQKIFDEAKKKYNKTINKVKRLPTNKWTLIGVGGAGIIVGGACLLFCDGNKELPLPPSFPEK